MLPSRIWALAFVLAACDRLFPYQPGARSDTLSDLPRLDQRADLRVDGRGTAAELGPAQPGLDPTFGDQGVAIVDGPGPASGNDFAAAAAIDSKSRIVVVGQVSTNVNTQGVHNKDLAVWRYLDGGKLDPSFGNAGRAVYHFGTLNWDYGRNLVIAAGDQIVVGGNVDWGKDAPTIWRLTESGQLDTAFNGSGYNACTYGAEVQGTDMVLDAINQRYVLLGNNYTNWLTLARFDLNGKLLGHVEPSVSAPASGARLHVTAADTILIAGRSGTPGRTTIWRFGASTGFSYAASTAADESASDLDLDAGGAILVCGTAKTASKGALAVWKLLPGGTPDTGYDGKGYVTSNAGAEVATGGACRVDASGRLVVAGTSGAAAGPVRLTLWRFLSDGKPDVSLGGAGHLPVDTPSAKAPQVQGLTLDATGRAVICGNVGSGEDSDAAVWRVILPP